MTEHEAEIECEKISPQLIGKNFRQISTENHYRINALYPEKYPEKQDGYYIKVLSNRIYEFKEHAHRNEELKSTLDYILSFECDLYSPAK